MRIISVEKIKPEERKLPTEMVETVIPPNERTMFS